MIQAVVDWGDTSLAANTLIANVYYYDETSSICGTWKYNEEGTDVLVKAPHNYTGDRCSVCGTYNTTIVAWGDSITNGVGTSANSERYTESLSASLPIENLIVNNGVNGRKLVDDGVVESIIASADSFDIVIVELGTNDWGSGGKLGMANDSGTDTFYGALNALKAAFDQKDVTVIFVTPLGRHNAEISQNGGTLADFGQAIKDVFGSDNSGKYSVIDGYGIIGIADIDTYSTDGLHINAAGHKLVAEAIYNTLEAYFGIEE